MVLLSVGFEGQREILKATEDGGQEVWEDVKRWRGPVLIRGEPWQRQGERVMYCIPYQGQSQCVPVCTYRF